MIKIIYKAADGIFQISKGMYTIAKHAFRKPITLEYPEKKPVLNSRYKGRLALLVNEDGSDLCIGCKSCVKVCPCNDLIQIETSKDENNKVKVDKFTIDLGRCIFCGNCTEVCPKSSIIMTNEFELADYSRESLVYDKKMLELTPEESAKWLKILEKEG